jgi:tetratricopeptide (TPR) repeat protein
MHLMVIYEALNRILGFNSNSQVRILLKKISLLTALFFVFQIAILAYSSNVSATKTSCLETENESEHTYLTDLLSRTRTILHQNPNDAKLAAWKGLKEAEISDDQKMQASFNNILGIIYDIQVKMDSAAAFYQKAYQLYVKTDNYAGMVKVLNNLGVIKYKQGQYIEALNNYESSINLLNSKNCEGNIADVFVNIGLVYKEIGEFNKSLSYFLKAQDKYRNEHNNEGLIYTNINLGTIYFMIKETSRSLAYYEDGLKLARERNDSVNATICLNNIAGIYSQRSDFKKALKFNNESLKITEKIGDIYGNGYSCFNIGETYYLMNRLEESGRFLDKAFLIFQRAGDKLNMAKTLESLARTNIKTGNLQLAHEQIDEALKVAKKLNANEILRDCYQSMAILDSIRGDYPSAFNSYKNFKAYNDNVFNLEKNRQMAEINARFDLESKQQQLELLEKKNLISQMSLTKKSFTISVLFGGILLIAALSVLIILYLKLRSKKKITELTLRNLRQQMNPHFIFNIMNSVYYSLQNNDKETSFRYLNMISKLMRKTLENSQYNEITIADEVDTLTLYLELEALRLKHKFSFRIHVEESIDQELIKIPTLLLQPFVENSIRHGISGREDGGVVNIDLSMEGKHLHCRITDNGIGRQASQRLKISRNEHHNSMGLAITDNRLRLISSVYGKDLSVHFTDLKNDENFASGTSVELNIPVTTL